MDDASRPPASTAFTLAPALRAARLDRAALDRILFTTSAGVHAVPLSEFAVFGVQREQRLPLGDGVAGLHLGTVTLAPRMPLLKRVREQQVDHDETTDAVSPHVDARPALQRKIQIDSVRLFPMIKRYVWLSFITTHYTLWRSYCRQRGLSIRIKSLRTILHNARLMIALL